MKQKWTKNQEIAIKDKGKTILISASAGSGKTSVLTQRVVEKITDESANCKANKILMVTFTNASAKEMKDRINQKINEMILNDPKNIYLTNQQIYLEDAFIGTISSFCLKLLKENFSVINLKQDFKIADESLTKIMLRDSVEKSVQKVLNQKNDDFIWALSFLGIRRQYNEIYEIIENIMVFFETVVSVDDFIEKTFGFYDNIEKSNLWLDLLCQNATKNLELAVQLLEKALEELNDAEELKDKLLEVIEDDLRIIKGFLENISKVDQLDFNKLNSFFDVNSFVRFKRITDEDYIDVKNLVKELRDKAKAIYQKEKAYFYSIDEEILRNQIQSTKRATSILLYVVKQAEQIFDEQLNEKNLLTYSKVERKALDLLCSVKGEEVFKTDLAIQTQDLYDYIFIDEYQDNNALQDLIFHAISKKAENLFMVGDVKQSIYSFRKADPKIFSRKREAYSSYNGIDYPCNLFLSENFRCKEGIANFINFLFSQVMSKDLGLVSYDKKEFLIPKAIYEETNTADIDVFIIKNEMDEEENKFKLEAKAIVKTIQKMISDGVKISDIGQVRSCKLSDFAIITRSNKELAYYIDELKRNGIPYNSHFQDNILNTLEVSSLISILHCINNPTNEIHLISTMISGIFDFTMDDIANIKITDKKKRLYSLLLDSNDNKIQNFINLMGRYRKLSLIRGVSEFIIFLIRDTKYDKFVKMMDKSDVRIHNLNIFIDIINNYENMGDSTLKSFLNYIDNFYKNDISINSYNNSKIQQSGVNVMTIHKSKGLEYNIVILAGINKRFNDNFKRKRMLISENLGLNFVAHDNKFYTKQKTLGYNLAVEEIFRNNYAEELRVLYVALTRAKQKLIFFLFESDIDQAKSDVNVLSLSDVGINISILLQKTSSSKIILLSLLRNKSFAKKFLSDYYVKFIESDFTISFHEYIEEDISEGFNESIDNEANSIEQILIENLTSNINLDYKYKSSLNVPNKLSVSEISKNSDIFVLKRPKFIKNIDMSSSEKGNALHTFMQFANYDNANKDPSKELIRLYDLQFLNNKEVDAIDPYKIKTFFESKIGKEILNAKNLYREYKLISYINANDVDEIYKDNKGDKILIQGIADCIIDHGSHITLIDYKTDFVKTEEELVQKYHKQLYIYKKAIEISMNKSVNKVLIYSFCLSKEIILKF